MSQVATLHCYETVKPLRVSSLTVPLEQEQVFLEYEVHPSHPRDRLSRRLEAGRHENKGVQNDSRLGQSFFSSFRFLSFFFSKNLG